MLQSTELRPGHIIEKDNTLWQVLNYHHNKTGRGSAVIKIKLKNLLTGATVDQTLRSGEKVKQAHIDRRRVQYQYHDGDTYCFMDMQSFDQIHIHKDVIIDKISFLKENLELEIGFHNNQALTIFLPNAVEYKVTYCEPGLKGDSVSSNNKPATIETGLTIQVPLFIEQDEIIRVDTRTGKYLERAK